MKLIRILAASLLSVAMLCTLGSCDNDKETLSRAVMASSKTLYFDVDGGTQIITIYADADWISTDCPDWVSISPESGSEVTEVAVTVEPNYTNGEVNSPRTGTLIFKGSTLESEAPVVISQDGFNFRNAVECSINDVYDLDDDTPLSLQNVIVAALGTSGFMVCDEAQNNYLFISSSDAVSVGDKISLLGTKETSNDLPTIEIFSYETQATGIEVIYPEPTDITDNVDSYNPGKWEYVCATGNLSGSIVVIDNTTYNVNIIETDDSFGLNDLNFHNVKVAGFFAGVAAPYVRIFGVEIEDLGMDAVRYFYEDFDWLIPYAEYYGCGDSIAASAQETESSIYSNCPDVQAELDARGYTMLVQKGTTGRYYLQKGYLKFGKTGYIAGIKLPIIEDIPNGVDIKFTFNWAPGVASGKRYDTVQVEVLAGNTSVDTFSHDLVTGDTMHWFTASTVIKNYNPTNQLTIRSYPWDENFDDSGLQRFYLKEMTVELYVEE